MVEDEAIVARDIASQVQSLGYETVGIAASAEHAMQLVERERPSLVLMDIQLSGAVDGIAAAGSIRNRFNVPVVFLTAFAADEVLERAKLTEPFGYILKPFSERELSTTLGAGRGKLRGVWHAQRGHQTRWGGAGGAANLHRPRNSWANAPVENAITFVAHYVVSTRAVGLFGAVKVDSMASHPHRLSCTVCCLRRPCPGKWPKNNRALARISAISSNY